MVENEPKTFTCAICQGEFEDDGTYTEEEAKTLARAKYPGIKDEDMIDLCPDCAQDLDDLRAEELEEGPVP